MERTLSAIALALSGAVVASAGAYAADDGNSPNGHWQTTAAIVGPSIALTAPGDQRDVIEPPSSIDPGMTLDPPQTGAKMPIIRPQATPGGKLILPR
jgi:hypothetical protein